MVNPTYYPPSGQIRRPARPSSAPIRVDPVKQPGLRRVPRLPVANSGQIIQPAKTLPVGLESGIRCVNGPQRRAWCLNQRSSKQQVSADQLPPFGKTANGPRFRLRYETGCRTLLRTEPGVKPVQEPR